MMEKAMETQSSSLAWRIPGTGEPGGLPSMGSHRVGHDWSDLAAAATAAAVIMKPPILPKALVEVIWGAGLPPSISTLLCLGGVRKGLMESWEMKTNAQTKASTQMFIGAAAAAKSLQSCLTLCDPIDDSPPGSPVPGILQARTLEWVAISFSSL